MNRFNFIMTVAVALIATTVPVHCSYGSQVADGGDYAASADSGVTGVATTADAGGYGGGYGGISYGSSKQNIPYAPVNTRGNTVTSSITYPQNKGEILIHRPAAIIVKRPPTKVLVNHPPLVVKPAPVVLHKPPAVVMRKVYVKQHPRPVKVEPVYVNVVKPPAEKYFVNEKQQQLAAAQLAGIGPNAAVAAGGAPAIGLGGLSGGSGIVGGLGSLSGTGLGGIGAGLGGLGVGAGAPAIAAASSDSAAANSGYQLLGGSQGLAALANLGGANYAPSGAY